MEDGGYGDPEVLNSEGLGHSLVLFWTGSEWKSDNQGRRYCELTIDPNRFHIIGCDDEKKTQLLLYRSHFVGSTIRSYIDDDTRVGVIERVFRNEHHPEMSPNISFYSEDEYPHKHFALTCGIRASFCFPFLRSRVYGVMEIVSTCNQDVATLNKFCQSFEDFDWSVSFQDINFQHSYEGIDEIDHFLEVVSQTFHLPLTQYGNDKEGDVFFSIVHQFSHRDFENLPPWCHFKSACFHTYLATLGLGISFQNHAALFCRDITALSITQYPLAHYARDCFTILSSISCFTIFLRSIAKPDFEWALQFFLPPQQKDNYYPQTLLNPIWAKMKECLPNYKLASGEQPGQVLSVKVINSSASNEPEFFKLGEHWSNSNSYEESAAGNTSKRLPHQVTDITLENVEEVSPEKGNECDVTPPSKRLKKSIIPCTVENITKQFGRPLKEAAESFGVSVSTFKRRCRDVDIFWWQPRKSKIIDGEPREKNFFSGMPNLPNRPVVACHENQDLNTMTVKVAYKTEYIRFPLPSSSGFAELEDNVIERLPLDRKSFRKSFSLKYQDDDGDWVLIACDKDVRECMKLSRSLKRTTIKMLLGPPINNHAP